MTDVSHEDLMKAGPGTLAGRYLRQFWQPVFLSRDLDRGKAKPIRVMDERFTLYRGALGQDLPDRAALPAPRRAAFRRLGRGREPALHVSRLDVRRRRALRRTAGRAGRISRTRWRFPPTRRRNTSGSSSPGWATARRRRCRATRGSRRTACLECDTYVRYSNYFYTLDNHSDEVHVIFTHRNTAFARAGLVQVPVIEAEETDYGMRVVARAPNGNVRANQLLMPNMIMFKSSPAKGDEGFSDRVAWRVPLDDDTHVSFGVDLRHVTGAAAQRYREAQAEERETHAHGRAAPRRRGGAADPRRVSQPRGPGRAGAARPGEHPGLRRPDGPAQGRGRPVRAPRPIRSRRDPVPQDLAARTDRRWPRDGRSSAGSVPHALATQTGV